MFATALTSQIAAPAALRRSAFKTKANAGFSVSAGRTIDTDTRKNAMKAKQDGDRKKAEAAKVTAQKLALKNKDAAAKAKVAAAAEKTRLATAKKANQAKYSAMNKTVGGSSKLIKKTVPFTKADPFANRKPVEKKAGGNPFANIFGFLKKK
eukprot:CAMPEP_0181360776 /NCGR_PEP_ID=MMETSP1106-20121128/6868_1 /TAXON_ID=81844 /ORGANISM="Mantoniella antarctica, Strain SL-175" /LENGTH=151 /DNA_ID=CAMNT_0023474115 /DNA_START=53 /DNA_END=508 /DNA_ORIENTATION=-